LGLTMFIMLSRKEGIFILFSMKNSQLD
jgi:hypothetical protein